MIYPSFALLIVALSVQFVQSETCGRRTAIGLELVSFGSESRLGEWPWHSAVLHCVDKSFPSYACGATILSRSYILTAAHCTYTTYKIRPLTISEMEVLAGITDIQKRQPSLRQMSVARIERHEEYNTRTSENDIALLQLAGELEFTDYVKPICLWMGGDDEEAVVGKQGYVAGWGRDENSSLPDLLKHVVMPIVSRKDCRASDELFYTRYLFERGAFCAGYGNGSSVNSGDSGSGLYIKIEGQWQLRGIVSKGKINPATRLVDTTSFIVFTDVAYFRPWVQSKMGIGSPGGHETEDYAVCGRKKELKFQRTGTNEERKWPWKGEIYRNTVRLCDVVIVSELFLLSPADVYSGKDVRYPVNLKAVFKNGTEYVLAEYSILRVFLHENYTRQSRINNIALLELAAKITFTRLLRPICVWSIESTVEQFEGFTGDYKISLSDYETCKFLDDPKALVEGTFCFYQKSHIIQSDFLYIRYNGTWYLRGVIFNVVWQLSGWYKTTMLDVYHYKDWILNQQHQGHKLKSKKYNLLVQKCNLIDVYDATYRILVSGFLKCYSSSIAPSLLITTGSCVNRLPVKSIKVVVLMESKPVRKIHLHPHFDDQHLINNIAIIELSNPIEPLAPSVFCLPKFSENLSMLQTLMPVSPTTIPLELIITNVETCTNRWRAEGIQLATDGSHICANVEANLTKVIAKSTLMCESQLEGMPLVYKVKSKHIMRGILEISLENRCDHNGLSEVFLDVMFYIDWIRAIYLIVSTYPETSVVDDEDEERMEEWRNLDPRNRTE